jgi:hypothetical protein
MPHKYHHYYIPYMFGLRNPTHSLTSSLKLLQAVNVTSNMIPCCLHHLQHGSVLPTTPPSVFCTLNIPPIPFCANLSLSTYVPTAAEHIPLPSA